MDKQIQQVKEFHRAFGSNIGKSPIMPDPKELALRQGLVMEEAFEVCDELMDGKSIEKAAKELTDLLYVTLGAMVSLGLQGVAERCFDAVHISNMSKLDVDGKPIYREDGKVLKGPNYKPADLSFLNQKNLGK